MKRTVVTFQQSKKNRNKLALLTAYDYSAARLADSCDIDGILVGDSLGMVCLGYKDTLPVTIEDMLHHTKGVARGVEKALVIADMPFMSYQASICEAIRNAGRLIQEGNAEAVKVEGGVRVLRQVRAIVKAQIPVMGHLGLTPQSVNVLGGFKVQGKNRDSAEQLIEDAKRLEDAGAFAIVLECIPKRLAARITEAVSIPTIGIGAGVGCDGQILVYHDMLGLYSDYKPKHVKVFANAGALIREGIQAYVGEVRNSTFPTKEHSFEWKEN
jgi:3-methyl-2-oxobutanoate hydroxymethyltransferase